MYRLFSPGTAIYISLLLWTLVFGTLVFEIVDGLTYQIVTVFITLIIVSNCLAKLYARILLNEDI